MASVSKRPKFLDNFSKCSNIEKDASEDITVSKSKNLLLFQIPNGVSFFNTNSDKNETALKAIVILQSQFILSLTLRSLMYKC